ncbi:MAG: adenylate/guanylate cyclase domain-containing protein [Pseudomonadota bacterium]
MSVRARLTSPNLIGVALLGALVAIALSQLSPVRSFESFLADLRISHHPAPLEPHDQIVIIAIDDASLEDAAYTVPIHRGLIAAVLQRLDKLGARAVAVDIVLDRPTEPGLDVQLSETLASMNAPVFLVSDPGELGRQGICAGRGVQNNRSQVQDMFSRHASLAHGVICVDTLDDVVRRAPPRQGGQPSLAEAMFQSSGQGSFDTRTWRVLPFRPGSEDDIPFPIYGAGSVDVLPETWIRDRFVLIGAISPYSGDFFSTPLRFADLNPPVEPADLLPRDQLPGVVVHAFALASLLDNTQGPYVSWWSQIPYAVLGALIGVFIGALRLPLVYTVASLLAAIAGYWLLIAAIFEVSNGTWLLPYSGLSAALLLTAGGTFALQERDERARRRMVQDSFAHFLSEDRVKEIISSPGMLALSAEEREVTFLFTDLEGFTRLVDTIAPDVLAPTLNGYLDTIVDAVVRHGGTVDKIVGDAIHAMFSAPLVVPDHRRRALLCALDIRDASADFQRKMRRQNIALGRTRVGISTGRALVGNFGSSKRFDYTAHGSIVNLAARLEDANKTFGTQICLAALSREECDEVRYREIGGVDVRGLIEPVQVFELLRAGEKDEDDLRAYADAFAALEREPVAALKMFEALSADSPDDGLVAYQIALLRERLATTS